MKRSFLSSAVIVVSLSLMATMASPGSMNGHARVVPRPLIAHPMLFAHQNQPLPTLAQCLQITLQNGWPLTCMGPAEFRAAYNLGPLFARGLDGRGRTIVIVDAFGSPTIRKDLATFDEQFGLPAPPSFQIISPAGPVKFDSRNPEEVNWAYETTLDVEVAHEVAPGANILLVTTPVSETEGVQGFPEIVQAENYVIDNNLGDVISQSFAATEETFPSQQSLLDLRSAFKNAYRHGVTVLAASGDNGATGGTVDLTCCYPTQVVGWPASDPLVTSVGGTRIQLDANANRTAPDIVWNDYGATGGGPSHVFARPDYQDSVARVVGQRRGVPDVSLAAFCFGPWLVETFDPNPRNRGWLLTCGTSEASPLFAGIVAIADQAAGKRLGLLNDRLYRLSGRADSGLVDVTSGDNSYTFCASACGTAAEVDTTVPGFSAGPGYDMASGLGTIDATRLVAALTADGH
ncbi:MAG: protease [Chloroflexi bacterium]|nr:MAG: protease [Chloroflexota bacterium]